MLGRGFAIDRAAVDFLTAFVAHPHTTAAVAQFGSVQRQVPGQLVSDRRRGGAGRKRHTARIGQKPAVDQ